MVPFKTNRTDLTLYVFVACFQPYTCQDLSLSSHNLKPTFIFFDLVSRPIVAEAIKPNRFNPPIHCFFWMGLLIDTVSIEYENIYSVSNFIRSGSSSGWVSNPTQSDMCTPLHHTLTTTISPTIISYFPIARDFPQLTSSNFELPLDEEKRAILS